MKILSQFKDYYDFVVFDTDPRKVYERKTIIEDVRSISDHKDYNKQLGNFKPWKSMDKDQEYFIGEVWFCDRKFIYLQQIKTNKIWYDIESIPEEVFDALKKTYQNHENRYHHSSMYIKLEEAFKKKWDEKKKQFVEENRDRHFWGWDRSTIVKNVNSITGIPVIFTRCREFKSPFAGTHYKDQDYTPEFVLNGPLSEIKFGQVVSPQEAYTEIYNFIPFIEPVPDKDPKNMNRFESKGFDKKTSFRNVK